MTMNKVVDELVDIEATGVARPRGDVAVQRLGTHRGAYRVMPMPRHALLLRRVEDDRRERQDGPTVRLAGELTATEGLCDVFALLGQSGWRGELVVMSGETTRSVFFDHGDIVGVCSDAAEDALGSVMYRYGALTREQAAQVVARERAGEPLAAEAFVTRDQLYKFLGLHAEEVVLALLMLTDGAFCFLSGYAEERLTSRRVINANGLLMNLVSRLDEVRHFRPWIPSPEHIPVRSSQDAPAGEASAVWAAIDGQRSVEALGRITGLGQFAVTKRLVPLVQARAVTLVPPRLLGGVVEAAELADTALRLIHRVADAGGHGDELRHSLTEFAQGTYDELLRDAGPRNGGGLDSEKLAANAAALHLREVEVREMLYDYVAFALFSATASTRGAASSTIAEIEQHLIRLRPKGQSGIYVCPAVR